MTVLLVSAFFAVAFGASAARLSRAAEESRATTGVRVGLWAVAATVVVEETLGVAGSLGARATALGLAVFCAAALARASRLAPPVSVSRDPWTPLEVGLAAALAVGLALRFHDGLHRATFLYDTLSYHLHGPATWMHDGRLSIVPAVFGDPAPAYAPSNVELILFFLMAPLRSDYLAQAGQAPLAALACLAVVAAARESGARRGPALASALALLLVPELWQQSAAAMTDVGVTAFFVAALPFLVRLGRGERAEAVPDAAALGLALGLAAGSKIVGLVYALPIAAVALPLAARRSVKAALALALAGAAAGGFWYARNLAVTGNPLYPLAVRVGGATLFPGLYDRATLRASEYHVAVGELVVLGRLLLEAGVGFAAGAALALARRPRWALLAGVLLALFWLVLPYQESRFLFPLWGVAAVAMAGRAERVTRASLTSWVPAALGVVGGLVEFPTDERWALVGVAALVGALTSRAPRLVSPRAVLGAGAVLGVAALVATTLGLSSYRARDPGYSVDDELTAAWSWTRAHTHGARVAYTGNNLPFPLAGAELANDVRYVNVAGGPGARLHVFAHGALISEPEPAPYRDGARYESWLDNLRATRRELVFVAAIYPGVQRVIAHDSEGFPVERAWADAHPDIFTLRFSSAAARVYAVAP